MLYFQIMFPKGSIRIEKSMGSKTESCTTPQEMATGLEQQLLILAFNVLSANYEINQLRAVPLMPYYAVVCCVESYTFGLIAIRVHSYRSLPLKVWHWTPSRGQLLCIEVAENQIEMDVKASQKR